MEKFSKRSRTTAKIAEEPNLCFEGNNRRSSIYDTEENSAIELFTIDLTPYNADQPNRMSIRVIDPEKTANDYVTYNVITKRKNEVHEVRRRYQDFKWLVDRLRTNYPVCIIPPLPEKHTFSKNITNRYNKSYLDKRCKHLDLFLKRVAKHPALSFATDFHLFISAELWVMDFQLKNASSSINIRSFFSKAKVLAKLTMDNEMTISNYKYGFSRENDYITKLRMSLVTWSNLARNMVRQRRELLADSRKFCAAYHLWAKNESTSLDGVFLAMSQNEQKHLQSLRNIVREQEEIYEKLNDYILYCDSVKFAIFQCMAIQMDNESLMTELGLKTTAGEKMSYQIKRASDVFRTEMSRWHAQKNLDLRELFALVVDCNYQYFDGNTSCLQEFLEGLLVPN